VQGDGAVRGAVVALELLAVVQYAVEAGGQHLVQGDAADRVVGLDRIVAGARGELGLDHQQLLELLGDETERVARAATGRDERLPQVGWQALVQGP